MPPTASNKNKTANNTDKDTETPNTQTATCTNLHKNGATIVLEEYQDIKDGENI